MESFFQIAEVTLEGLVTHGQFLCFSHLVSIIRRALYKEVWTETELQELEHDICEYKSEFVNLYGHVREKVRGGSTYILPYSSGIQAMHLTMTPHTLSCHMQKNGSVCDS